MTTKTFAQQEAESAITSGTANISQKFYRAAWRWHFYAGLYVVPFLLMLSVTGLIMVYFNSIETRFGERLYVEIGKEMTSPVSQANAVQQTYPKGTISQYMPPPAAYRTALIQVKTDAGTEIVSVNPYTNKVLSNVIKDDTWCYFASDIHGTLLIGDLGDRLIEIAAGLTVILIVTGLYLRWPRAENSANVLWPNLAARGRTFWKELHVSIGFYTSLILFFFLLSGLAWAGIWGGQFVQAWSTFPAEKWDNVPVSDETHASMNHGALKEVPWGLELAKMPISGSDAGIDGLPDGSKINLTTVNHLAKSIGFGPQYRINLPQSKSGVYTISADSMDGDTEEPTGDRTVHVDQYTGKILAEVGFADYSLIAKSMAVGIALHQGDLGWWNGVLNAVFCLAMIFLCISGIIMWWKRRPSGAAGLIPPPMPANLPLWKGAVFLMLLISIGFPLVGLTLLAVLALDLLVLSRIKTLKKAFQ